MKQVLMASGVVALVAASAYASVMQIDSRTVMKDGVSAKLVRFNDPSADCPDYGELTVSDNQKVLTQQNVCGAENILAALQGDEVVIYTYARDADGGLGLYRYVSGANSWDYHDFNASKLTITSMGNEVMVKGFYPSENGKPDHMSWTWHPRMQEPKQI